MSEKHLDEDEWKKFAKSAEYKDASLVKALAALAKAEGPEARAAAAGDVQKQGELLLKANKGDKKLAEQWKLMAAALERERKASSEASAARDDDESSPALLTTQLVTIMRLVAKGESYPAMVALQGSEAVVLVSRKPIGASQKKLLAGELDSGSIKYLPGSCLWEKNCHTFVLETEAAGLAKRVKAALLQQTGVRMKIRVRGLDPNDVDEDLDEGDGEAPQVAATTAATPQDDANQAAQAAFDARLAELQPRLKPALTDPKGDGTKLRALLAFAQGKAEAGQFAAAMQGLDALAKQLGLQAAAAPEADVAPDPAKAFNARLAALVGAIRQAPAAVAAPVKAKVADAGVAARDKEFAVANGLLDDVEALIESAQERGRAALDEWHGARAMAIEDIEEVIEAVRETGDPQASAVEIELRSIIANLTESPSTLEAVAELRRWLEGDDVITAAEEVPARYGSLDLRGPLLAALAAMDTH